MANSHALPSYLSAAPGGCLIQVRVQPRASRTAIAGPLGDALKVAVTGPPVDGKANAALCRFLAKRLKVAPSALEIVRGQNARQKLIMVHGVSPSEVHARL